MLFSFFSQYGILVIIVLSVLVLLCLVINAADKGIFERKKKRWNQLIEEKSYKLKSLREMNQLWAFSEIKKQFVFRKQFPSQEQFEQYNPDTLFHSVVGLQTADFLEQLEVIRENKEKYSNYQICLKHQIVDTPEKKVKEWGIPPNYYYTYEKLLYEEELLTPDTDFTVRILLQCKENTREKTYSSQAVKNKINQIWKYKVKAGSEKLKALSRLNYKTSQRICYLEPVYEYSKFCDSLNEFKKYEYTDLFIKEEIQEDYASFSKRIQQARQNKVEYDEYIKAYYGLLPTDQKVIAGSRIPDKAYVFYEQNLCEEQKLAAPVTDFKCKITVMYISPKGRNQNTYERTYSFNDILWLHQRVKNEWNNKQQYQQSREYERSRMTNSLRYDVMKRDGFRCVLCGVSQLDGAKLHVDHIKPVAKGGKTEMSNLRTLCDRCNSGKRDKYDPLGVN